MNQVTNDPQAEGVKGTGPRLSPRLTEMITSLPESSGGLRTRGVIRLDEPEHPLVTVITIVYNGGELIQRCIESVLAQTYDNIEYIIVDGGSNDNTVQIVQTFSKNIDVWLSECDGGIYDAMNKGICLSTGALIALLNSDDFYFPDTISTVVTAWLENPRPCVIHGDMVIADDNDICVYKMKPEPEYLCKNMRMNHPTWFVHREIYEQFGLFDKTLTIAADYELARRFVLNGVELRYISQAFTQFRPGGASAMSFTAVLECAHIRRKYREHVVINIMSIISELVQVIVGKLKEYLYKTSIGNAIRRKVWQVRKEKNPLKNKSVITMTNGQ